MDPFADKDIQSTSRQEELKSDPDKRGYTFQDLKSEVDKYFEEALLKSQHAEVVPEPPKPVPPTLAQHKSDAIPKSSVKKSQIVDIHTEKGKVKNRRAEDIRKRVRDTHELRDLIVINEILNKPKALRNFPK